MTDCLRWCHRRHSWRRPEDGGFTAASYDVVDLDDRAAKRFVEGHHYSGTYVAAKHRFGLYDGDRLVGVAVFSVPVQAKVLTGPFPTLAPYDESIELGRFVLVDDVPANGESWFLARCFDQLEARGVRGVVAFSDPVPRTTVTGEQVMPGHVGVIYQASNGICTAQRGEPGWLLLGPDGRALSRRAVQKIRAGEPGARYAEAQLVTWGARPRGGEPVSSWLPRALSKTVRRVRHPGNYRYLFRFGRRATTVPVGMAAGVYPKRHAA